MLNMIRALHVDEQGFIVSAEMALVATVTVLGMAAGLPEMSLNVAHELKDIGSAFGNLQESYSVDGVSSDAGDCAGARYEDASDHFDSSNDLTGRR